VSHFLAFHRVRKLGRKVEEVSGPGKQGMMQVDHPSAEV
jgi:hypothetical protein